MWRRVFVFGVRITILGTTDQFRFLIKCNEGSNPKFYIFEGGHWKVSCAREVDYYLDSVDSFDAVVRQHQGRGWVTTKTTVTRLSVVRN